MNEERVKLSILIVDDDEEMADVVDMSAKKVGYQTLVMTDSKKARELLQERRFDVLLTDLRMPEVQGLELVKTALTEDDTIKVIIITGDGTKADAIEAIRHGVYDFLDKPFSMQRLEMILKNAYALKEAERDRDHLLGVIKGMTQA